MSATPTGADAMKEAERLITAHSIAAMGVSAQAYVEAKDALLAFIRKLVEAQPAAVAGEAGKIADEICREVAELPDRNSPEDWPDAMLVTHSELRAIVLDAIAAPAAPLVGPMVQPTGWKWRRLGDTEWHTGAPPAGCATYEMQGTFDSVASPAAPAGVPTDAMRLLKQGVDALMQWRETDDYAARAQARTAQDAFILQACALLSAPNSFHLPACDSSEASGSAIPARPTLPGEATSGETPNECPKCGLEEWDYVYEAGRVSPSYKHCCRCDTQWSAQ